MTPDDGHYRRLRMWNVVPRSSRGLSAWRARHRHAGHRPRRRSCSSRVVEADARQPRASSPSATACPRARPRASSPRWSARTSCSATRPAAACARARCSSPYARRGRRRRDLAALARPALRAARPAHAARRQPRRARRDGVEQRRRRSTAATCSARRTGSAPTCPTTRPRSARSSWPAGVGCRAGARSSGCTPRTITDPRRARGELARCAHARLRDHGRGARARPAGGRRPVPRLGGRGGRGASRARGPSIRLATTTSTAGRPARRGGLDLSARLGAPRRKEAA